MKQYNYKIIDPQGKIQQNKILAENTKDAELKLKKMSFPIVLNLKQNYLYSLKNSLSLSEKPQKRDIINFTRQLHILLSTGIPLVEGLSVLKSIIKNKSFLKIVIKIINAVHTGESFSQTLKPYKKYFGIDYLALVEAGESSGNLEKILSDLYQLLEWEMALKQKIWDSIRYPIIVLSVALLALVGMFTFVIPKFAGIYAKSDKGLPAITAAILSLNNFLKAHTPLVLAILLITSVLGTIAYKKTRFKFIVDNFLIHIPVFGLLYREYLIARFCKIFSMLYTKGIAILPAIGITKKLYSNAVYQDDLSKIIYQTERGSTFSQACNNTRLFSGIVAQTAKIGEKSSSLGIMLEKVSAIMTDEINYMLNNIFTYIEPVFVLVLGVIILLLSLGVFLPMWKMASALSI
ncbi:type II secretion system F family protein [Candidatus Margulisiibacteriota bacterium]